MFLLFEVVFLLGGLMPGAMVPDAVLPAAPPPVAPPSGAPRATAPLPTVPRANPLDLRVYQPADLEPEPAPMKSSVAVVEIQTPEGEAETAVFARPRFASPAVGHVPRGARIALRGQLSVEALRGCPSQLYYALQPLGWICADHATPTDAPPSKRGGPEVLPDSTLPYSYRSVRVEEGASLPMWRVPQDLVEGAEPMRALARGDSIAVTQRVQLDGTTYYQTHDDRMVPAAGTVPIGSKSDWQGVVIGADTHLPFAWVSQGKAPVRAEPGGETLEKLSRRTRVDVLEEQTVGRRRWLRVGEGRWVDASHMAEVRVLPRPDSTLNNKQWIDIDLGEQVVVAYENDRPVYATLTSSGRTPNSTPRGDYPVWAKVSAITMKSQSYDDEPYYVDRVPWVLFFQAHNALHAAYWHDRFGGTRSHGCANLAPKDARYLFEWLGPKLPPGFSALRFWDLSRTPVVHVRNSRMRKPFRQERQAGPPDREEEAARLEAAIDRRAEASDVILDVGL